MVGPLGGVGLGLDRSAWPANLFHPLPGGGRGAVPSATDGTHVQGVPAVVDVLSSARVLGEVDNELGSTALGWVGSPCSVNDAWITRFQWGSDGREHEQACNQATLQHGHG